MAHVEIIEANLNNKVNLYQTKKKVCAYARVSTDSEEQLTSYSSQIKHYSEMIKNTPDWEFVGIYADEGISGTQVKHRKEFTRMINDALNGRIDIIIAKSISRFARNTLDTLKYIRMLREKSVDVFFEKENIHTLNLSSEMFLTLYSAFAQAESESTSMNVKMGLRAKMKRGELVGSKACYGYTWNAEKQHLEINEAEAVVVRKIFDMYASGKGNRIIARELNREGYTTKRGRKWSDSTVSRIIHQEKYCGDLLQQKSYISDVLTHRRERNNGVLPKYFTENHHEGIVSKELWNQVRDENISKVQKFVDQNRSMIGQCKMLYEFSNKIECGCCHKSFVRRINGKKKDGSTRVYWACTVRKENKKECLNNLWLRNEILESMFIEIYNSLMTNKHKTKELLNESIKDTIKRTDYKNEIKKLKKEKEVVEEKLSHIVDMLLGDYKSKELYLKKQFELQNKLDEIIGALNRYEQLQNNNIDYSNNLKKIEEVFSTYNKLEKFDRNTFDSIVDKIIIGETDENGNFNPNIIRFVLRFKSEYIYDLTDMNELNKNVSLSNNKRSKYIWNRTCKYA